MQSRLTDSTAASPRGRVFWGVVGALVVAQFVAFYMLCAHQVQVAQARDSKVAAHSNAIRDCLEASNSTIGSCIRLASGKKSPSGSPDGLVNVMSTAVPVNFAYR